MSAADEAAKDPPKDPQMEILRAAVLDSCVEMLASSGHTCKQVDPRTSSLVGKRDLAGFIGFAGRIRGSLTIAGSTHLFRITYPSGGNPMGPTQVDLFDWTSEMTNQILGRVKRRLCERGTDFDASLPVAIEGRELWWRHPARARALDLFLAVDDEVLAVHFEVTDMPDGKIFPDAGEPISHSVEGDTLLF